MTREDASPLEQCLLEVVRRELEGLAGPTPPQEALDAAARAFLGALRREYSEPADPEATLPAGVSALESALTIAVQAGATVAGVATEYGAPALIVQPRDEHGRTLERAIEATQVAGAQRGGERAILLTDRLAPGEAGGDRSTQVVQVEAQVGRDAWRELEERAQPPDPLVGKVFDGKYKVEKVLGKGGFGVVYKALDQMVAAPVAIKTILSNVAGSEQLTEFKEEAKRVTRLDHPNIIQWKALNEAPDGTLYFVMEYLEGEELEDLLVREERLEPERAARLMLEILGALRAAHHLRDGKSILHLDLKPKNVFMTRDAHGDEMAKVIDFGIGQLAGGGDAGAGDQVGEGQVGESTMSAGQANAKPGVQRVSACTPPYCSPEQATHVLQEFDPLPLDGRADLYSFGVMAFRMLTGEMPFEKPAWGGDRNAWLRSFLMLHVEAPPKRIADTGAKVPAKLARFVERCLNKKPDERFADTHEAYNELERIVAPGVGALVVKAVAATAAVAAVMLYFFWPEAPIAVLEAKVAGVTIEDEDLYAGPEQPAIEVDLAEGLDSARYALVDQRVEGAQELQGWSVEAVGPSRVRIVPDEGLQSHRVDSVFLARAVGDEWAYTDEFRLVWLDVEAWELTEADVPERAGRAVVPRDLDLRVALRAKAQAVSRSISLREDVASVRATAGDAESVQLARVASQSDDAAAVYRVALEDFALAAGSHALEIVVEDRAGGRRSQTLELDVVLGAPGFENAIDMERATHSRGTWYAPGAGIVTLRGQTSRPGEVVYSVLNENGELLNGPYPVAVEDRAFVAEINLKQPGGGETYRGSLALEFDETKDRVLHANPEVGRSRRLVPFVYRAEPVDFAIELAGSEVLEGGLRYEQTGDLKFDLSRAHQVPLRIALIATGRDREPIRTSAEMRGQSQRTSLALSLPEDGRYDLEFVGQPLDEDGAELTGQEPIRRRTTIVFDAAPPTLELAEPLESEVVRDTAPSSLRVRALDPVWVQDPESVSIAATLQIAGPAASRYPRIDYEESVRPGEVVLLSPFPWDDFPEETVTWDGSYRLSASATDVARNVGDATLLAEWEVAIDGPAIVVRAPLPDATWNRSSGLFVARVETSDPNGVAEVPVVTLRDGAGGVRTWKSDGERRELGAYAVEWRGTFELPSGWANSEVELRVEASDRYGNTTIEIVEGVVLEDFQSTTPTYLSVAWGERPASNMLRVAGNPDLPYTFGGRTNAAERSTFRAHGLEGYTSGQRQFGLRIEVAAGEIRDFYMDEFEVSVASFLAFVEEGYADPVHWPTGTRPVEAERRDLAARLERLPGNLAVTEVTWNEAAAYARWCGKKLPGWLQWEYAVRGGLSYLPYSCAPDPPTRTPVRGLHVNVPNGPPLAVDAGPDRSTAFGGLHNLCSNVAEWTRTPGGMQLEHSADALVSPDWPAAEETDFFAVGGSFDSDRYYFSEKRYFGRSERLTYVGFRCVIEADKVDLAYEDRDEEGYRVAAPR